MDEHADERGAGGQGGAHSGSKEGLVTGEVRRHTVAALYTGREDAGKEA